MVNGTHKSQSTDNNEQHCGVRKEKDVSLRFSQPTRPQLEWKGHWNVWKWKWEKPM